MIKKRIKILRNKFKEHNIDGYLIPKNDEFFSEYSVIDRLKTISGFTGSAGIAVILKNNNYLFVDGRYTIQAEKECAKNFKIIETNKALNPSIIKGLTLGLDPKLFTNKQIKYFFSDTVKLNFINENLIDKIYKPKIIKTKSFFSLGKNITGENYKFKINKVVNFLKKNKIDYLFISAPENVAWLLNIRGYDNPNSPIPNCRIIIGKNKKLFFISNKQKTSVLRKEKKIYLNQLIEPEQFKTLINRLKGKYFLIDTQSCSIFNEQIIRSNFKIKEMNDPCYKFKSIKNSTEIRNMINAHIEDGLALTRFIYWIKHENKKKITEVDAQIKLEKFRKKNSNYLYPSFETIAGSGENGAIVHYRAKKESCRSIKKNDIFLCDSGGQYKYGTTDVTRTLCFSKPQQTIKNIYTKVLKGHIAVANTNLELDDIGKKIDKRARRYLNKSNLDYAHGTGHGVGFFLNVHEGPQSISKFNNIKIQEGMILSNEPGYYKKGKFGIRIENLVYVKKTKNKIFFENLTLAPLEKELINYNLLTELEKNYLFKYHLNVYIKISNFLNVKERKWLASFI